MAQQIFRHVPAAVQLADDLPLGHFDIVEERLAERAVAADQQDRLGRHAGARHVEQQEAYPLIFVRLVGADQAENPVGLVGIARPDLLAVDDPVIALVLAERLQRHEVRPRPRLRIALAPADLALRHIGQDRGLLLLGAEFEQRRPKHPDAERIERRARLDPRHFLAEDLCFGRGQSAAAIGFGPVGHGPAARRHRLEPMLLRR